MRVWTFSNHPEKTHAALITITVLHWTGIQKMICMSKMEVLYYFYSSGISHALHPCRGFSHPTRNRNCSQSTMCQCSRTKEKQTGMKREMTVHDSCFVMRPHTISTTTFVEIGHARQQLSLTWLLLQHQNVLKVGVWLNEWQDRTITDTLHVSRSLTS